MPSVAPLLLFTIVGLLIFVWTKKQKWKICSPKLSSKHIPSDPGIPLIGHLYQIFVHGTGRKLITLSVKIWNLDINTKIN